MDVNFYKNSSEPNKLDKTLTAYDSFDCTIKNSSSVMNPTIIVESSPGITDCNYMIIPSFGRNYFITDIVVLRGARAGKYLYAVSGHVDVLTTYKEGIRKQHAIIGRQETAYNVLLDDTLVPMLAKPLITQQAFSNGFTADAKFILLTSGNK